MTKHLRLRRSFLLLQGPAGPFFAELGQALAAQGHDVNRVNFCGGDWAFSQRSGRINYTGSAKQWPDYITDTQACGDDLLLFGDCRPLHAAAIPIARANGARIWVYEEGYLRPHWITLERDGTNGYSSLPRDSAEIFSRAAELPKLPTPDRPAVRVSSLRHMVQRQAIYHAATSVGRLTFPHWRTHRPCSAWLELARGWITRAPRIPLRRVHADRTTASLYADGRPFFLFPLQLDTDYQIRVHSEFDGITDAIRTVLASFRRSAPPDALLVIKNHPLDNGIIKLKEEVARLAREHDLAPRVRYIDGGHLPTLLSRCRGVVTVNSTTGLSALIHGKPVKALGQAVYDLPGLCFQGHLDEFWHRGTAPDSRLLKAFRAVTTAETQIFGGFYSMKGIRLAVSGSLLRLGVTSREPSLQNAMDADAASPVVASDGMFAT
jgi:capsular polysaccharide export protein